MKHPSAYYLLLLYTLFIGKPFLPVVQDILAHAFWETSHLATVHQHQGTQHLQKDVKDAARQDAATTNTSKTAEQPAVHLLTQYSFVFSCATTVAHLFNPPLYGVKNTFLEIHIPPPKA